jgi:hypothetical protein
VPARLLIPAIALVCALAVPLRLSADAWAYAAYGALLTHGLDPWAHAYRLADLAALHDPLLDAALRAWDGSLPRDVYGPLFTLPCAAMVLATRSFGPGATVAALRGLAAATLLVCIGLANGKRPRLARLLAFHPVVLWSAAEGHNDTYWLALVLGTDYLRGSARVVSLAAAAAVKAVAVIPLVRALSAIRERRAATSAVVFVAMALLYAPLGWGLLSHGFDRSEGPPRISLLHAPALAAWSGSPLPLIAGIALVLLAIPAVIRALRGQDRLAGLALLGWIVLPSPEPWYATWLVPVAAHVGRTPASRALLAASFTSVVAYIQDTVAGTALRDPAFLGGTMLALYALPLIVALLQPAPASSSAPQAPPTPPPLVSPAPQTSPTSPATGATPAAGPVPSVTPTPVPAAPPTPLPTPSPGASPTPTTTPTSSPSPSPAGSASPTPLPYTYIVSPSPGPSAGPQIVQVALNDHVLHKGGPLLVRVTTTVDVITVVARTMGHEIGISQIAPGVFSGAQQLPDGIPFFLLGRNYTVEFVATTADGRSTATTLNIRLER